MHVRKMKNEKANVPARIFDHPSAAVSERSRGAMMESTGRILTRVEVYLFNRIARSLKYVHIYRALTSFLI
jgi:hypothetical protein